MTLILTFLLLIEIPSLYWAIRRSGFLPFPHSVLCYVIGAQIFLWLNAHSVIKYNLLEVYGATAYRTHFTEVCLLLALIFIGALLCVPRSRAVPMNRIIRHTKINLRLLEALVIFLLIRLLIQLLVLDWEIVWRNDVYLAMASQAAVRWNNSFTMAMMQSQKYFGIIATIAFIYLFYIKRTRLALILLPVVLWHVLFEIAGHSRTAVVYFVIATFLIWMLGRSRWPAILTGLGALATQFSVLGGRNLGHHGFSSLPKFFENAFFGNLSETTGSLTNIFEGAFITAEYFSRSFPYAAIYKNLSLSPLFSGIDGFESIRRANEWRLSAYAPNSAISEILSFGLIYAFIYFTVQFAAGWYSARLLVRRPEVASLTINGIVMLAAYLQFTYSVRTVFRLFVIALVASIYLTHFRPRRRPRRRVKRASLPAHNLVANS